MNDAPRPLLDLHHLGHRQTGNETWARSISAALFELDGPRAYDIAVTREAPADDLALLPARETVVVGSSSTRRLALELPAALRRLHSTAVLVQYTAPPTRVPAVVAVHDLSFEHPRASEWLPPASRLRYKATIRASVRRAAHVLALSESTRRDLIGRYDLAPERVSVVSAAVDPALKRLLDATPELREGQLTVLVVGNVLPRKNLVVVAQAVRIMRERGHDVVLRIVGSVPDAGRAQAETMSGVLGESLQLIDHVTRVELARAYRSAHVLAFPSLYEGFGIPVVEAMAAGLPVVVSDRTSLPEVVGDAGLVVPAEDPSAWADALWSVVTGDELREHLISRGWQRHRDFSWEHSAAKVSAVLATVVRSHPP